MHTCKHKDIHTKHNINASCSEPRATESYFMYEVVSISFRTGRLERELQMVQLSATKVVSLFCESV